MLWCVKTLKTSKLPSVGLCAVGCKDFNMFKVPQCWDIVVIVMHVVCTNFENFEFHGLGALCYGA